jgi:hypothetical protein
MTRDMGGEVPGAFISEGSQLLPTLVGYQAKELTLNCDFHVGLKSMNWIE